MKKKVCVVLLLFLVGITGLLVGCGDGADGGADGDYDVLEVFINHAWYPVDHFNGIIPDVIREATGVDLNVTIVTDPGQLGLMIAAGDLPDIVFTSEELDRLSTSSLSISFNELMENYGANFDDVNDISIGIAQNLSGTDNFYTILNHFSTSEEWAALQVGAPGQPSIVYRRDLLSAIGIDGSSISSVDELMEVLITARDAYPDMIPFGLGGFWKFQGLGNAMGIDSAQFNADTGEYVFEAKTQTYREFLRTANRMYREGLITIEQLANENEAISEQSAFNNEVIFFNSFLSYSDFMFLQEQTQNLHSDAQWGILPYLGSGGVGFGQGWSGAFVSRNVSNPEAAARLLTFLHSIEGRRASLWGREGIDFTLENGMPVFSDEFMELRASSELVQVFNWRFNFGSTAIEELYLNISGSTPEILDAITTYGVGFRSFPEVSIARPTSASPEGIIFANLEEAQRVHEPQIIQANTDEEFDELFQNFMDVLEQFGVQQYNEYVTNNVREVRARFGWD